MTRQGNTAKNTDLHFLEEKEPNAARYFLSITYGLTGDPEIKEIIEKLSQEE